MAVGLAPALPLTADEEDGHFTLLKSVLQTTEQNLKMLILTCPGERIMDINFGVGIRNYLFEQYTPQTLGAIRSRILQQVNRYMPQVTIEDIIFDNGESINEGSPISDNMLSIRIEYGIPSLVTGAILTLPISSGGTSYS